MCFSFSGCCNGHELERQQLLHGRARLGALQLADALEEVGKHPRYEARLRQPQPGLAQCSTSRSPVKQL